MESSTPYSTRVYDPLKGEMEMRPDPQLQQPVNSSAGNFRPNNFQAAPRDHLVWSIFNFFHCNFCCLGLLALVFSVKARDRKNVGDMTAASSYGSTAKILNIVALLLSLFIVILIIVLFATGVIVIHQTAKEMQWKVNSG